MFYFVEDAAANPTFYADITNPQSLNKYQYAYNNPLRYNDPTGHCPTCIQVVDKVARVIDKVAPKVEQATRAAGRAAPYLAGAIWSAVVATSDWARNGNTTGDASCQGCGSSQRMGQHLMEQNIRNQDNSKNQGNVEHESNFDKAREKAFDKAGMKNPSEVTPTKYDPKTGTAVEFKGKNGAKVAYDSPHADRDSSKGHDKPHVGWQTGGKRSSGGTRRGNITYVGPQHPHRAHKKLFQE